MRRAKRVCGLLLLLAGLLLGGYLLLDGPFRPMPAPPPPPPSVAGRAPTQSEEPPPEETPAPDAEPMPTGEPALIGTPAPEETAAPDTADQLPAGKLVVTNERKSYRDGNLSITIPVINITRSIYNGTDKDTLNKGVGLYEYAQLPGEGNRNVSLAGHRNGLSNGVITDRAPFFYIDTLQEGDYLYIYNSETIYRYLWESCEIIEPDNWDPIRTTDYSCLTITSCHPIGIADHRIVVRARLDEIIPYHKEYEFPASMKEVPE